MNLQSSIKVSPINVNNQQTCSCLLCAARAISTNTQSPININTTKYPSLNLNKVLRFHYQDTYNLSFRKGGHNAHVDMTNTSKNQSVFYQGKAYDFFEFHLHTTSEHTFNGQARKMELHMVHATNPNLPLDSPNQELLILGVTIEIGATTNKALDNVFFKQLAQVVRDPTAAPAQTSVFNPSSLLPQNLAGWHYEGSLTSDPFTANADWFVFKQSISVSQEQFNIFQQYLTKVQHHSTNNRPTQNLPTEPLGLNDFIMGTQSNDVLTGTNNHDRMYGDLGNDRIDGGLNNDYLDGGANNDVLIGGNGNDTLFGAEGSDILIGVKVSDFTPGTGEIDVLFGSQDNWYSSASVNSGSDKFILGDANHVYYLGYGGNDYALIKEGDNVYTFNDIIQLKGNASMYELLGVGNNATELYYKSQSGSRDLIALIEVNDSYIKIDDPNQFIFV